MRALSPFSAILLLASVAGCSKDANPTPDAIIETGYFECADPAVGCDGVTTCTDEAEASVCVQAQPDVCNAELTCECVGAWLCADLPCADTPDGIACGEAEVEPPPPPPEGCLEVDALIDAGDRLIFEPAQVIVEVRALCDARIDSVTLLAESSPNAGLVGEDLPALPLDLAAGTTYDVVVSFQPPADPERLSATLEINGDARLRTDVQVQFVRPAGGACLELSPMTVDFGRLPVGESVTRQVNIAATCAGDLAARVEVQPAGIVDVVVRGAGPIQPGEGGTLEVEVTPVAEGFFAGEIVIEGAGQPVALAITGSSEPVGCPDAACPGGTICSALGTCVTPIEFVFDPVEDANETWFAMPRGRYFEAVRIRPDLDGAADRIPFMPCDACIAGPECAEQPERVARVGTAAPLVWDGVWWLTDTMGDDCSRPQPMEPGDYFAIFCLAVEPELDGPVDQATGIAPGRLTEEFCLAPVAFTWPLAEPRIVATVPIID